MKFLGVFILGVCMSACSSLADPSVRGKSRFIGLGCATCHRFGEGGGGGAGPDLTTVGRRHSTEWLDRWMADPRQWKSNTTMPSFHLTNEVRAELVAYLATLKGEAYRRNPPWNSSALRADPVKRGEMIYSRTGCVACHGVRGKGGFPNNNVVGGEIPSLVKVRQGFTRDELKERLLRGRRSEPADISHAAPLISMPAWGDYLKEDEIDDLITYLYSLDPTPKPDDWSE